MSIKGSGTIDYSYVVLFVLLSTFVNQLKLVSCINYSTAADLGDFFFFFFFLVSSFFLKPVLSGLNLSSRVSNSLLLHCSKFDWRNQQRNPNFFKEHPLIISVGFRWQKKRDKFLIFFRTGSELCNFFFFCLMP